MMPTTPRHSFPDCVLMVHLYTLAASSSLVSPIVHSLRAYITPSPCF